MRIEKSFNLEEEKRNDIRISCLGVFFVDWTSKVLRFTQDEGMSDGEIQQCILTRNTSLYTFELLYLR